MIHKFAVLVDKTFYNKVQYNNDFYLRVLVLDVVRALVPDEESVDKYSSDIFYKCAKSIAGELKVLLVKSKYLKTRTASFFTLN
jgi:hypothetical protein